MKPQSLIALAIVAMDQASADLEAKVVYEGVILFSSYFVIYTALHILISRTDFSSGAWFANRGKMVASQLTLVVYLATLKSLAKIRML